MVKKMKGFISLLICISMLLCTAAPVAFNAADETQPVSELYFMNGGTDGLLWKAQSEGLISNPAVVKSVWFVDKNDYDLTGVTTADYSARHNGSVLAWYDETNSAFYIGGNGKIVASSSLNYALGSGTRIDEIHGLDLLDTSNVTNMAYMFSGCGKYSKVFTLDLGDNFDTTNVTNMRSMFQFCGAENENFTLDLGDNFDTSKVTDMSWMFQYCGAGNKTFTLDLGDRFDTSKVKDMSHMFYYCGQNSETFTLDLSAYNFDTSNVTSMRDMFAGCGASNENFTLNFGEKFDTSKVTDMAEMFLGCGKSSKKFTELDLSGFTVSISNSKNLTDFASDIPVTSFIFGEGWANAVLPTWKMFTASSTTATSVIGATPNLIRYKWSSDKRTVTFPDKNYYTITPEATEGGTAWNGGSVVECGSIDLYASADSDYTFVGWYDGDTKVCDTETFTVENVSGDKTYTARFIKTSKLFSTDSENTLLSRAVREGLTDSENSIRSVSFVDLNNYDLTGVTTADYSQDGDGRTLAWYDSAASALYIGGEGKVTADSSLSYAFYNGQYIDAINGFDLLDTTGVNDMSYMFAGCGQYSDSFILDFSDGFYTATAVDMAHMFDYCGASNENFTLDLGYLFYTGRVRDMSYMFAHCGMNSKVFTLDLGKHFDTDMAENMEYMFAMCGQSSKSFTELDLSGFIISFSDANGLAHFADSIPVTSFVFGDGWESAVLPDTGVFNVPVTTETTVTGATTDLVRYNWAADNRTVTFPDKNYYTVTADAETGGTASGGGAVAEGGRITLTAAADDGYVFDGWYDGDTKVCDVAEFTVENVTGDITYTAKFVKQKVSKLYSTYGKTLLYAASYAGLLSNSNDIKVVSFVDLNDYDLTDVTVADYSAGKDKSVLAWYDSNSSTLYIGGYGKIIAGNSLEGAFKYAKNIDKINGLDMLDTSNVTSMSEMFEFCGNDSEVFTLDLGDNFDTSNVTDMDRMFYDCGYSSKVFTLDLGDKFDTSSVVSMKSMFESCGSGSEVFTLDLGDKFDTSNVTNMWNMFDSCGRSSEVFTLNLGDKFDTSNSTDTSEMFKYCGYSSKVFTLDLGDKFDTSSDVYTYRMFEFCGYSSEVFTLDLGDKFDTSNVTHMSYMFYSCGYNSPVFTLDLGDKFDTSNVIEMSYMFMCCGRNSKAFTELDLSGFTITFTEASGLSYFAQMIPVSKIIFGEGWANATLPEEGTFGGMFYVGVDNDRIQTEVVGATPNLIAYKWKTDKRDVFFSDKNYYIVTANRNGGGSVSGGGTVLEGTSVTLIAAADYGYTFDGWYDGDTKVCETLKFTVENVTENKTYTARFTAIPYYRVSAAVGENGGGTVSGDKTVLKGSSVTLTAAADEGYTFDGWYDGDTKVCETLKFTVENVTENKTYTARFTKDAPVFDFTSLRTLKTKNITVNHETKTIDIEAEDNAEYITIFVHQKEIIPGGTFRMASYLGNKVVYDPNGSYRIYFVHNFTVPVKANITIDGVSKQYMVNVKFDNSKAKFDFAGLKGESFSNVTVNHSDKTVHITANESADSIILYVNQHDTVYGGKLRMASYLGNKVSYDSAAGVYTIYAAGKNSVSVKSNITIDGVTEQYLITVDFPGIVWGFDTVRAENVKNVSIDHENKVVTIDTNEGCDSILLYIDQSCPSDIKGQIWMKSYMGNKVLYNAADRTYTISKRDKSSIVVKTKITMLGETRYYDIVINFTDGN